MGSTALLHPQGTQKLPLSREGAQSLGWLRGSHHPADNQAGREPEVGLTEHENWVVLETTGPLQTFDPPSRPSPPQTVLRDTSLTT